MYNSVKLCCVPVSAGHYGKRLLICVVQYRCTKTAATSAKIGYQFITAFFFSNRDGFSPTFENMFLPVHCLHCVTTHH